MRLTKLPLALLLPAVVTIAVPAYAQQPPQGAATLRELTLEQLGNIEVTTVTKRPEQVWRSPAAIVVLTRDDIRRSGATTLPELLRLVPGVQVSRLDSNHWAIGIRGLANAFSKSLLVLIDGRSVYTPLFGGVFWQVQDTLVEDIERIEIIRGPGGTIWGTNAVNGVINVITRSSRDTRGTLVSAGGGTVDRARAGIRHGGGRGDLSYRVYGKGFSLAAEHHTEGHPFDDWQMAQAGFRIDATSRPGTTLTVQGDIYKGRAGDRLGVGSFDPPARLLLEGDDRVSGGNILARWERDLGGGAGFRLQAYYDRTNRRAIHFGESRDTFDADFLYHGPIGSRHDLSWGAGARYSPSDFTPYYSTLDFSPEDNSHRFVTAFAQDEIELRRNQLWLTVGSKFEHNNFSGLEIQPSARLLWRRRENETWWTSIARAVRSPSRIDTDLRLTGYALADPLAYTLVVGSADFEAESLVGIEGGYRRLFGSQLYVDVAAFHNQHDGLSGFAGLELTLEPDPIPHLLLTIPFDNVIRGTTRGVEIAPEWRPASWWSVTGSYSFLTIDMESRPGFSDEPNVARYEGASPRHQGFVKASLSLPHGIEIDHAYRGASGLSATPYPIPGYVTADARVGWEIANGITLAVTGQNLLQSDHVEFFRDEVAAIGIKRSVYASLTWTR